MNFAGEPGERWQGDGAEKEFATVPAREPGGDVGIGTDAFAEFGDDVGVEQMPVRPHWVIALTVPRQSCR